MIRGGFVKIKTLVFFWLLLMFSSVTFAAENEWQLLATEKNSEGRVLWQMYFDKVSVYKNEDGTVTFWAKYVPFDNTAKEDYKTSIKRYVKNLTGKEPVIKDAIYCVYRITVDFAGNRQKMSRHYWYNDDKGQSFIASYDGASKWGGMREDFVAKFAVVKEYIANK